MSGDQAQGLRDLVAVTAGNAGHGTPGVMWSPGPDKSALWDALKSELEAEADGGAGRKYQRLSTQFGPKAARIMLDRMLQMEALG